MASSLQRFRLGIKAISTGATANHCHQYQCENESSSVLCLLVFFSPTCGHSHHHHPPRERLFSPFKASRWLLSLKSECGFRFCKNPSVVFPIERNGRFSSAVWAFCPDANTFLAKTDNGDFEEAPSSGGRFSVPSTLLFVCIQKAGCSTLCLTSSSVQCLFMRLYFQQHANGRNN